MRTIELRVDSKVYVLPEDLFISTLLEAQKEYDERSKNAGESLDQQHDEWETGLPSSQQRNN